MSPPTFVPTAVHHALANAIAHMKNWPATVPMHGHNDCPGAAIPYRTVQYCTASGQISVWRQSRVGATRLHATALAGAQQLVRTVREGQWRNSFPKLGLAAGQLPACLSPASCLFACLSATRASVMFMLLRVLLPPLVLLLCSECTTAAAVNSASQGAPLLSAPPCPLLFRHLLPTSFGTLHLRYGLCLKLHTFS